MKGIGKEVYSFDKILGSLSTNRVTGNLSTDRITGLTEKMTEIAAQGIKLYKLSINKNNWVFNGASSGQTQHLNSWHWYRYNTLATTPTLPQANNAMYTAEKYYLDTAISHSPGIEYGDSYSAKCVTYLYCDTAKTLSINFVSDDDGTVWLNGTQLATITTCTWTGNVACPFKQGWNELVVVYTEGSGADGWDTSPKLYNNPEFRLMCADLGGFFEQSIAATPVGHNVTLTANMVLSELMFVPTGNSNADEITRYELLGLNRGILTAKAGAVSIQTIGNYPDMNMEVYVLAKEYK